jgi:VCBS repeat-containing protein
VPLNYVEKFDSSHLGANAHGSVDVQAKGESAAHAPTGHSVIVPDANLLFTGDFKRAGSDLVLSKDGHDHVVHDYFKGHIRATLSSPDGAQLSGSLVESLTGEVQVAQAGGGGGSAAVIGHVTKLTGSATAIRNGVSVMLNAGDNVNKGDVVQAGADSSLGLTFIDGTVFGLSSNARMVLNEMVYDPNGSSNSSLLSLVQGTITFVAGETAKHGDMKVDTPVATMGIRGTAVLVEIGFEVPGTGGAPPVQFQVLVEPGGHTGSYVLYSKSGATLGTVNQSGQVTLVNGAGDTTTTTAPPLSQTAQDIITYTLQQYFPNYVPNANPKGSGSGSGSTPPFSNPDPLKFIQPPDLPIGVPVVIPINLPDGGTHTSPIDVTITRFNTAPTVNVTPVIVTLPVDKNAFDIPSQVTITDPDSGDVAVPYVPGTARLLTAVGPSNSPPSIDLAALVTIDPQTGHVSYNPAAFKFLAAGQHAVYTIGFDSQSGPDTLHETLTFTVDGSNDAPVVTAALTAATTEGHAAFSANLLAGASDPDNGETATLTLTNVKFAIDGGTASTDLPAGFSLNGSTLNVDPTNAAFDHLAQGETETIVVSYDVTDAHGVVVHQTETITVTGINNAAVVSGDTTGDVVEAGTTYHFLRAAAATGTATGTLTDTDVDNPANTFQPVGKAAPSAHGYGSYTIDVSGHWTYYLDNGNAAVQALNNGDVATDSFTVKTADGTEQVVTITIHGTNDAAVISGDTGGAVVEAGGIDGAIPGTPTACGTLTDTDVDNPANTFQAVTDPESSALGYGTYTVDASGHWTYTLDNKNADVQALGCGETATDTFTVTSADGTEQVVSITITGTNDAAVIDGDTSGAVVEAGGVENATPGTPTAYGTLTDADVDNPANTFQAVTDPVSSTLGYGNYTVDASGHWTYTLDNTNAVVQALGCGETTTDTFTVKSADGTEQVVTITITGTNDAPVVVADGTDAGPVAASVDGNDITAQGTIAFSDVDLAGTHSATVMPAAGALGSLDVVKTTDTTDVGTGGSFGWTYTADPAAIDAALLNSSDGTLTETFTVTIHDNHGGTVDQTVTVTVAANVWIGSGSVGNLAFSETEGSSNNHETSSNNNWNSATNWSLGVVPGASEIVLINSDSDITLNVNATVGSLLIAACTYLELTSVSGAHSLTVADGFVNEGYLKLDPRVSLEVAGTMNNSGTVDIDDRYTPSGASLVIDHTVTLEGGGTVILDGTADRIVGGTKDAKLINVDNTINGYGKFGDGHLGIVNGHDGTIAATDSHHSLVIDTGFGDFINHGAIDSDAAGGLEIERGLVNASDGTLSAFAGRLEVDGNLVNHGTLNAFGGKLVIDGDVTGHGHANITGGTLEFGDDSDTSVHFASSAHGTLVLDDVDDFSGAVTGFGKGDSIDLTGISSSHVHVVTVNGVTEVRYGSGHDDFFTLSGDGSPNHFVVGSDHHGGTEIEWQNAAPELDTSSANLAKNHDLAMNHDGSFKISGVSVSDDDASPGDCYTLDIDGHQVKEGSLSSIDHYLESGFDVSPKPSPSGQATVEVAVTDQFGATDKTNFIFNTAPLKPNTQVTLTGTDGNDVIFATGNKDVLTGGCGADQFVFGPHSGSADKDTITDFQAGVDKIELDHIRGVPSLSGPFAEVQLFLWELTGGIEQKGNNTLIHLDGGDTLQLNNVHMSSLHASDFIVHPYSSGNA